MKIRLSQLKQIIKEEVQKIVKPSNGQTSRIKENKNLNEGHSRITEEEMAAWKNGDWGFVSEIKVDPELGEVPDDYEPCGTCGYDHEYDLPYLSVEEFSKVKDLHSDDMSEGTKKGLWANIHARRKAGKSPKKPGEKGYPKTLDVENES